MSTYDDKLLNAVAQFPVIFNHMMSDYKNADVKAKAWEDVQRLMETNEPIEKIRQRWKSIRDSYVKYLNKKDRSGNLTRVRPYKFERQLRFLKPFLTARENNPHQTTFEGMAIESADQILTVSQYGDDGQSSNSSVSSRKRKRNDLSVFDDGVNNTINGTMSMMNQSYRIMQQNDDVDSFFHGLAQTMKKLRPLTVAKLKKEIANMITDAEIRELEEADKFALTENGY